MALPELDLRRIKKWCDARVPERIRDQLRVEYDATNTHVTIVETRPPWNGAGEWTRFPIARLRYTKYSGLWTIYWRDRNLKFHEYPDFGPTQNIADALAHIDADPTGIFWG